MKIHSDTLTESQLYTCKHGLPVYVEAVRVGSRSRDHGFIVRLSSDRDELHRRSANSGQYGSTSDTIGEVAATWDDWGVWIDRLFALDPKAIIGPYNGRDDFYRTTQEEVSRLAATAKWNRNAKPQSLYARTHTAPWLDGVGVEDEALGQEALREMGVTVSHRARLEELRVELRAERISWGELAELQSLAPYISEGDVELLEAAGVPEHAA